MGIALNLSRKSSSKESIELHWLVRIRWMVIASLFAIFLGADYLLDLRIHSFDLVGIAAIGALSNLILGEIKAPSSTLARFYVGAALILDVILLTVLLFFYGGYTNPFSMMFLAYVTLAAVVLNARWTWIIFAISLVCFLALFYLHIPLPQMEMHAHHAYQREPGISLHMHGMLVAFILIGVLVAFFVTRMNRELSELRRIEDERRRLMGLATLTAGAAHELATPLATLSLIGDDLFGRLGDDPVWRDDLVTMREQLRRCSGILNRMRGSNSEIIGEAPSSFSIAEVIEELKSEFSSADSRDNSGPEVIFEELSAGDPALYSLRLALVGSMQALLRNAIQACGTGGKIVCSPKISADRFEFVVRDNGPGMTDGVRARVGEPFFTSKAPGEGMGLGLYLTKLFAIQVGGAFVLESEVGRGTTAAIRIPRIFKV